MLEIKHEWREAGAGEDTWLEVVIPTAYAECSELRQTGYEETYQRILGGIVENDRIEFRAVLGDTTVAVASIVLEEDMHVGECLSIQWAYVLPEYRDKQAARPLYVKLQVLADIFEVPYAYTERTAAGRYRVVYGGFKREPR